MAARRLIIIMLVLLVVSSAAAALVPTVERSRDDTSTTTTETTTQAARQGDLVKRTLDADPRRGTTIELDAGDRLELIVKSQDVVQIEIPSLGLLENAAPLDPARFDLLLDRPGTHEVRVLMPQRRIADIVVAAPGAQKRSSPKEPESSNTGGGAG